MFLLHSISMDAFRILLYLLLIIPYFCSSASNDCPSSYCGQNFNRVRFPFRLIDQQHENCGFPGFDLTCLFPSTMLINLPGSGYFAVRSIDYHFQAIRIYDNLNCLPARLATFDLSNSPFSASYFRNYTLLTCPNGVTLFGLKPIDCLSNSSFSVLATDNMSLVTSMTRNQPGCVATGVLRVPVVNQPDQDGFTSQLDEDISLTWGTPDCESCEAAGVSCGYSNRTTQMTTCFFNRGAPKGSSIFRIIVVAMAIPVIAASLMVACFMCTKDRRDELMTNRRTNIFNATIVTPDGAAAPPSVVGLDQATIESYTKVILGESKRLPGHHDATCPICLSEYDVKEMVRCIPECGHCFHADCIDEWLKMNGTCPICRNSLSPVHVES